MSEEDVLRRWMGLEAHRMTEGAVLAPVPLSDLLVTTRPASRNRVGGLHEYDTAALRRLADATPLLLHHRLKLPITFYVPHDLPGDAYVEDQAAIEALQALGAATTSPRAGRLWLSLPLAQRLLAQWPTLMQTMPL